MSILIAPTLVSLVGVPSSGKSTIATILKNTLGVRHLDIDADVRAPYFGVPPDNDGTDETIARRDRIEMAGAYDILFGLMQGFLRAGRSLITSCTMSSEEHGQRRLDAMFTALKSKNRDLLLRVIWCKPELSDQDLQSRIEARLASGYTGATTSARRVRDLEALFNAIVLPHLVLNTVAPDDPSTSAKIAIEYVVNPQPHDL